MSATKEEKTAAKTLLCNPATWVLKRRDCPVCGNPYRYLPGLQEYNRDFCCDTCARDRRAS